MNDSAAAELQGAIEELEQLVDRCGKRLLKRLELHQKIQDIEQRIEKVLPADSDAFRVFDRQRRERDRWWRDGGEYAGREDCRHPQEWLAIARSTLALLEPEFLRPSPEKIQFVLTGGDAYNAKKHVFGVMKRASRDLSIVDSYMDDKIFPYLESIDPAVNIRLLTHDKKPIFPILLKALQSTRSQLEARQSLNFHDRFLILDTSEVWQLGASINRLGEKTSMLSKVTDGVERQRLLDEFDQEWRAGTLL